MAAYFICFMDAIQKSRYFETLIYIAWLSHEITVLVSYLASVTLSENEKRTK